MFITEPYGYAYSWRPVCQAMRNVLQLLIQFYPKACTCQHNLLRRGSFPLGGSQSCQSVVGGLHTGRVCHRRWQQVHLALTAWAERETTLSFCCRAVVSGSRGYAPARRRQLQPVLISYQVLTCLPGLFLKPRSFVIIVSTSKVPICELGSFADVSPAGSSCRVTSSAISVSIEMRQTLSGFSDLPSLLQSGNETKVVDKMASAVKASWNWLKMAWATQPVLFISCVFGAAGMIMAESL